MYTRPKPVEHGYVFSMTVGTIGEWRKLVPFLLGDEQLIRGKGGASSFMAVKNLKINILAGGQELRLNEIGLFLQ